jgi:hypothetical protein
MSGPYVNDDGDVWVERGAVRWPKAVWAEARIGLDYWDFDGRLIYDGIERHVLVSDEQESACLSAQEAVDEGRAPTCGCCRVIDAYHFHGEER